MQSSDVIAAAHRLGPPKRQTNGRYRIIATIADAIEALRAEGYSWSEVAQAVSDSGIRDIDGYAFSCETLQHGIYHLRRKRCRRKKGGLKSVVGTTSTPVAKATAPAKKVEAAAKEPAKTEEPVKKKYPDGMPPELIEAMEKPRRIPARERFPDMDPGKPKVIWVGPPPPRS